jgi:hypothetical protein
MGEIAEMMLDGTLCEGCGVYLPGDGIGVPRRCRDCAKDARGQPKLTSPRTKVKVRSGKADLPKWATHAVDDVVQRFHCAHCIRHFVTDDAARQHVKDNHA